MDETSDPHMETDVSSTTEDVPEMQEVSGSNGNVVLIVEKIDEEHEAAAPKSDEKSTHVSESSSPSKLQKQQSSPPQIKTIPDAVVPSKPPMIQKIVLKRPSKPIFTLDQLNNAVIINKESKQIPLSTDLHSEDRTVDSSGKFENQNSPTKKSPEIIIKSPRKDVDVEIILKKTFTNVQNEMQKSPEKSAKTKAESTTNYSQKIIQNTPVKEQPNVKTPPKEQVEHQKSPQKAPLRSPAKEQEDSQRSPQKNSVKTPTNQQEGSLKSPQKPVKTPIREYEEAQKSPEKAINTPTKDFMEPQKSQQQAAIKTPTKEQGEIQTQQKTPVKDQQEAEKPTKTFTKELTMDPPETKEVVPADKKLNGNHENCDNNKPPTINNLVSIEIDRDTSNDSQLESLETIEKDHNKSISRELKSLINSAKESKIISECTQLTSKTRKSRTALDSSNPLNTSVEADKIQPNRRISTNSQKSNCSEKSDKMAVKRSMRSQNPEFVNKVKLFLHSVTKIHKDSDEGTDEDMEDLKSKEPPPEMRASSPKKKKIPLVDTAEKPTKLRIDPYCWRCHWATEQPPNEKAHPPMHCTVCPRAFHFKCLSGTERNKINTEKNWVCPECMSILHAESSETRSPAMKKISLGMLCELLKFALQRMMDLNGVDPFMQPVDRTAFPDYDNYVVHPMDLSLMKDNIDAGLYGSTEAFLADAQWILHNSIIFNTNLLSTVQSKLTGAARALVRSCRAEMGEIEACSECYKAAHARRPTWFTDVCTTPHVLLWAKLKGFPYWPAKGMSINNSGLVDVRFFGAHDRAWVPAKDCFLYSERDPNNFRTKRQDILDSMQEAEQHIRNISRKYGKFVYPPFKTQFDPSKLTEQIKLMIPSFEGEVRSSIKDKSQNSSPSLNKSRGNSSRSNSKSSKEGLEGDTSEGEDTSTVATRKMADGAEIAREEDGSVDKNKTLEVSQTPAKENEKSRKRRHSQLEEAVITVMDINVKEKKRKVEDKGKSDNKTEPEPTTSKDVEMKIVENKKTELTQQKTENTPKTREKVSTPTPSSSEKNLTPKVAPIRIITTPKGNRTAIRSSTPKIKFVTKPEKRSSTEKISSKDEKKHKRRNSKTKTLNSSNPTPGKDKLEKKNNDKSLDSSTKEKVKDTIDKNKESVEKTTKTKQNSEGKIKDRLQFDDDTSLAVLARRSKDSENDVSGLPTISSVMSLSTTAQIAMTTTSQPATSAIELMLQTNSRSSIFTPTSKENVSNMKDAVNKLQQLKDTQQSLVGKVGVRAFARMTSPPMNASKDVEVEIKAEPIDLDDSDRQMEKMEVMNAFHLRPVNPPSNLREVRINKLVVAPLPNNARRGKVVEVRPRAKKSFPQPARPEGRSELNGKNSMVYIPIQPANTPGPRPPSTITITPVMRQPTPATTSNSLLKSTPPSMVTMSSTSSPVVSVASSPIQGGPTVGQATVHTVPLITSVNGQWTLALQPVMSVGAVDSEQQPMVNGSPERLPVPSITTINNLNVGGLANVNNIGSIANVNNVGSLATINAVSLANLNNSSSVANANTIAGTNVTGVTNITSNVTGTATIPIAAPAVATPVQGANKANDTGGNPGEPPRLQQRPALLHPLDARTLVAAVPTPSAAGPLTAKLNQNAVKLADYFRTLLEDSLEHLDEPAAQVTSLKLQLEQMRWRHQQEIDEINHNHELTLSEMRTSLEKERARALADARRAARADLEAAVSIAKAKQWCANCSQEAQFYCCWNTSYCDYPCQRSHWTQHFAVCTQKRSQDGNASADANSSPPERLQPQPENLPKSAPKLTAAKRPPPPPPQQQDSIIMSVMEDARGNQTLKCVGTYKPPAPASSVLLNKQMINNDDNSNKKVVTTGGYLIVGGGVTNSATVVSQSRKGPTIQYYS
ncbi:MYND-type zinc finger-containing chromatin reader Zmynd8-like isoform X2 [Plodia interpunctella]|uniref:MYND-type zinc finger-containing chromatin reader Zmynd8-like isoform X2 n=1 Tax=Plodia interpunctella TaxID=58824 RepID=UPI002367F00C|nr:uncharacterized protein LOC128669767 isoform X2 [Plodia interpunctella]